MICVGHSHIFCVLNAAKADGAEFRAILLRGRPDNPDTPGLDVSRVIFDEARPDFGEEARALLAGCDGPLFSFVGATKHVSVGLRALERHGDEPAFDFVLPEEPELPLAAGAEVVPHDAVVDVLREEVRPRLRLFTRVAELTPATIYHFDAPPPVSDRWLAGELGPKYPGVLLPSRFLRYKIARVTARVFREHVESVGARFVEAPAASVDGEGFLRDELVRNLNHGNTAYGALVLEQMKALA